MVVPTIVVAWFYTLLKLSWFWIPLVILMAYKRHKKKTRLAALKAAQSFSSSRTMGSNQQFIKCHFIPEGSKFTTSGFQSEFKAYFSKETFCFTAVGVVAEVDGAQIPQVESTWCESLNRKLSPEEINQFFEYIMQHDQGFIKKLKLCID